MAFHEDGRTYIHDADNIARIYERDNRLWVTHAELLLCGYRGLQDFDIVYLNGRFFELQGHIRRADAWWIEEVELDDEATETETGQEAPGPPESEQA